VRVLVFHGYLLHGTGSNVYNANLAAALVRLGHEVHLLCQERAPEELPFVDAAGDWDGGALRTRTLREPVRCTVYRPALAGVLPVYVADRYAGIEARPFPQLTEAELAAYVAANVRAVQDVVARARPDVALANHLVMGPLVLKRALGGEIPYAVKIHGSALEYTVRPHPRFLPAAREGLAGAHGILVGSHHIADRLWATLEEPTLPKRTRLGPPGVDVQRFTLRKGDEARNGLEELARRLAGDRAGGVGVEMTPLRSPDGVARPDDRTRPQQPPPTPETPSAFARDPHEAARALTTLTEHPDDRLVAFVGKLIVSKGIDLLIAAWPLVLVCEPSARLVVVGFGAYRTGVERLIAALADGDTSALDRLVEEGRAAEGGPRAPLRLLRAFLDSLDAAERTRYLAAARKLRERVVLTGRLDHGELAELLPACEALVVPSTFPEAFGMVAAEAAACGALPVCAAHSGLAEVAEALAAEVPAPARPWLAFPVDERSVRAIAERVVAWLAAPADVRDATRAAVVAAVRERWSWEGVARGVIAAAEGRLDALPVPRETVVAEGTGAPAARSDSIALER
jgi:glycosyltransferase involved in cell wall biosynthesis